jgi:hypothetical protein
MRWTGGEALMGDTRNAFEILEDQLEDTDVDVKIILKYVFGKQGGKLWTGCI